MKVPRKTIDTIVTVTAVLILVAAIPSALMDTFETGRLYLFSPQFFEELPERLTGPGRLRFIFQPLVAIFLGVRSGLADFRAGSPPFLYNLFVGAHSRKALLRDALSVVRNLLALGVALDAVAQFFIYGQVHPGAALVVGPILIFVPYTLARALSNRVMRHWPSGR